MRKEEKKDWLTVNTKYDSNIENAGKSEEFHVDH